MSEITINDLIDKKPAKDFKKKAVALLSGGLDSTLATKLIKDKGFEIVALNFHTSFCTCNKEGCQFESKKVSTELNIPLKIMNVTKEYLSIVRNPKYGYGSGMNPCIDCRIFMFKKAKEYMEEIGASFIITGEVLGQRPMSQGKWAIHKIEQESGLEGLILRPLTSNEFKGSNKLREMVDFGDLPIIWGRSRRKQLDLAKNLNIENFICGTGGCMLTAKEFALKLKDYFEHNSEDNLDEIKLLKVGRHFRLSSKLKLIVGRNEQENKKLEFFKQLGLFLKPEIKGPSGLICGNDIEFNHIELSCQIMSRYSKDFAFTITYVEKGINKSISAKPLTNEDIKPYRIC